MKYCGYHLSVNPACALFVELMYVKFVLTSDMKQVSSLPVTRDMYCRCRLLIETLLSNFIVICNAFGSCLMISGTGRLSVFVYSSFLRLS